MEEKKLTLKQLRLKKGYSQSKVAVALGWTQSNYSDLELGKRGIELRKAKELATILGTTLNKLFEAIVEADNEGI